MNIETLGIEPLTWQLPWNKSVRNDLWSFENNQGSTPENSLASSSFLLVQTTLD